MSHTEFGIGPAVGADGVRLDAGVDVVAVVADDQTPVAGIERHGEEAVLGTGLPVHHLRRQVEHWLAGPADDVIDDAVLVGEVRIRVT